MKILIIGGMHGNEPLGIALVDRLQRNPIKNVEVVIANPRALKVGKRFTDNDLNRSFAGKDSSYESMRAKELLELCLPYDVVLDFHNTHCPENDCAFIGENARDNLADIASFIGLPKVIVADYDCINKYAPNCISVEISLDSPLNTVDTWIDIIQRLASTAKIPTAQNVDYYRFVYRMTLDDKERLDLPNQKLRAFQAIDTELARAMSVDSPAYPIFIADSYTPYNYGGILNKLTRSAK